LEDYKEIFEALPFPDKKRWAETPRRSIRSG